MPMSEPYSTLMNSVNPQFARAPVLVVDDEPGIRALFKENLEEGGYVCHTAADGDTALKVLATEPVDVVLLDIMMPGIGGGALFQRISERYPDVAVIFVTGVGDLNTAVNLIRSGASDFVVKPVTRQRLLRVVQETLAKRMATLDTKKQQVRLEEQVARQLEQLESMARELSSLNRLFQADLDKSPKMIDASLQSMGASQVLRSVSSLQEPVKERVAEYLHGPVRSKLAVLEHRLGESVRLVSGDPQKASMVLGEIEADLRDVEQVDIRQASHELYPFVVKLGLVPALRSLRDRFWQAVPIELSVAPELHTVCEYDAKLFPEVFKVGVYRIIEEALANVARHAHASAARVEAHYLEGKEISVHVTDNGRGFEPRSTPAGFGLLAMNDYAGALGGSCLVNSSLGHGTRVDVFLPVPADEPG